MGNPTCYKHNGLSSVDYGLVSPNLYAQVTTFSVRDPVLSISDHAPISMTLKTNVSCNVDCDDHLIHHLSILCRCSLCIFLRIIVVVVVDLLFCLFMRLSKSKAKVHSQHKSRLPCPKVKHHAM